MTHCLAIRAGDYWKRASVMRVTTSDWHTLLLQAKLVCRIDLQSTVLMKYIHTCTCTTD